jgi:hypothetical protein
MTIKRLYFINTTEGKPIYHFLNGQVFKGCSLTSNSKYEISLVGEDYFLKDQNDIYRSLTKNDLIHNLGIEIK